MNWGNWHLDQQRLLLSYGGAHEVDLSRCRTSGEVLEWIMHLAGQAWLPDTELGAAIRALHGLLSPQKNICPVGGDRKLDRDDIRSIVDEAVAIEALKNEMNSFTARTGWGLVDIWKLLNEGKYAEARLRFDEFRSEWEWREAA